jgi:malate dehydrogenase (oxaloacetate-decarboxylating)(NADP+)
MANPDPEIRPELVAEAFGDKPYVMATGRSDYPNQINNVLCFPFLFRGALDVKARKITMGMKLAAAKALADAAHRPVDAATKALYPNEDLTFGRNYIIPKPFDKEIMIDVSSAVAQKAVEEGVARVENFDIEVYKQQLRDRQKNM